MSSSVKQQKELFSQSPDFKFKITTHQRKELMLTNDLTTIHHGALYDVKFNNLGGGIWEMFTEKREPNK